MNDKVLEETQSAIQKLIGWYWSEGVNREGVYKISGSWLSEAYNCLSSVSSIMELTSSDSRPSLAVWGPSQTGKSTMLSKVIDHPDKFDSALNWSDKDKYIFSPPNTEQLINGRSNGITFPPTLNPFNNGGDGSAVVGRYYLTSSDTLPDTAYPVKMSLGSIGDLMQALAIGYIQECDTQLDDESERVWSAESLEATIQMFSGEVSTKADKNATELVISLVDVISEFVNKRQFHRYTNLAAENQWQAILRSEILNNSTLLSDPSRAIDFICEVLWDNSALVNKLFEDLLGLRSKVFLKTSGKPLYISLPNAGVLLDMDFSKKLDDKNQLAEITRKLESLSVTDEYGYATLGSEASGDKLFDNKNTLEYQMGLLQAICWELAIPLNKDFAAEIGEDVKASLLNMNLLDIPGVSKAGEGDKDVKLRSNDLFSDARVFNSLLKKGKTFSVINKYAREYRIDALLLLIRSSEPLSTPNLLSDGIRAIWESVEPNYRIGDKKDLPVPLTINLTFFMKVIKNMFQNFDKDHRLDTQEGFLAPMGKIVHPDNCYTFVTNYPHLPDGEPSATVLNNKDQLGLIYGTESSTKWINSRFNSEDEKASFEKIWENDGGVGHLFSSQARLIDNKKRAERLDALLNTNQEAILSLLSEVSPDQEDDGVRAKSAVLKIKNYLETCLKEIESDEDNDGYEEVVRISSSLKTAFSCDPQDIQSTFLSSGFVGSSKPDILLRKILNKWAKSKQRSVALRELSLSPQDVPLLLEAISNTLLERSDEILNWLKGWYNFESSSMTEPYKKNAVRYIAAYLSKEIKDGMGVAVAPSSERLRQHCENKFDEWTENRSRSHIELVILPFIEYLDCLSLGKSNREPQPGDQELIDIIDSYDFLRTSSKFAEESDTEIEEEING
ncbi:hypothetical protein [Leucothrix mucor]|uniref:hypothetical protein n=1 Tax=Leucothrix mucor TaxID=45248 RepID=UPI00040ACD07|nr:hypothetical protein [Leucothrix mucor]